MIISIFSGWWEVTTWLCSTRNQLPVEETEQNGFSSRIIVLGRTSLLLRQMPGTALKQAGYIRDGVIPEDTDRLRSLLCFQHGVLHYDGLFHQVGRKVPITVNGCTHYRCVNNRAIWQSAEGEKLYGELNVKMQSTDLVGPANERFPVTSTQKASSAFRTTVLPKAAGTPDVVVLPQCARRGQETELRWQLQHI